MALRLASKLFILLYSLAIELSFADVSSIELSKISQVQGNGASVTSTGMVVVEAVVTAVYPGLDGFFIQEEDVDHDGDARTSEAIFIHCRQCTESVERADKVRISGNAGEFKGMSQISLGSSGSIDIIARNVELPSVQAIQLPVPNLPNDLDAAMARIDEFYEPFEGMRVVFSGTSVVAEYFQLGRYGEVILAHAERFRQFTDVKLPSELGLIEHQIDIASRKILLDDGSTEQNPRLTPYPSPNLSRNNYFRGGDTILNLEGILHYGFGQWRVQPTPELFDYIFESQNPRPASPKEKIGNMAVASFNVLNYFSKIDTGQPNCGPAQSLGCRGADSDAELKRQQAKLVSALCSLEADIIGLMELQNPSTSASITPIEHLVLAVNQECGGYKALVTGPLGSDAITVGLIYRDSAVSLVGEIAVLQSPAFLDPNNSGQNKNRPALAQTFEHRETGERLTVVVNHMKSKGSSCGAGDDDTNTGQGNCNGTRTAAVSALIDWLASRPIQVDTDNILILGDLNAYRKEAPIQMLLQAGYTDLIDHFIGEQAYSYVFAGQVGYLDYALASNKLLAKVVGVDEWHINADEINLMDYNEEFKPENYLADLYSPNPFRSSDHDPVIVQFAFGSVPKCRGAAANVYINKANRVVGGLLDGQMFSGVLIGSGRSDVIVGSAESDLIVPLAGSDIVCSGSGNDTVLDADGDDYILGEAGDDRVSSGNGKDTILGGAGDDTLSGGRSADVLDGGEGNDTLLGGQGKDDCRNGEDLVSCF